jgi:uncharacterized protein (DUF362 family)
MKRRDFIQKSVSAGLLTGAALSFANFGQKTYGANLPDEQLEFDLVAVRGGEPALMFDKAIAAMGGMQKFISKNQTVVVKPNIGWDRTPEKGANTNPDLVKRIIEHAFKAGAKDVYVFDNPVNELTRCYANSGIEKAVNDAGGKMVAGNNEKHYHEVEIKQGKILKKAKVHQLILESDVFINVPILKSHGGSKITMSMKNLMGVVWDRKYWHANNLHQCIADFATFRKPDLNVLDAYRVMKRNGPQGVSVNDVVLMQSLLLSTDMVAIDAAGTKLIGMEVDEIDYIKYAALLGVGNKDLDSLNIHRIKI